MVVLPESFLSQITECDHCATSLPLWGLPKERSDNVLSRLPLKWESRENMRENISRKRNKEIEKKQQKGSVEKNKTIT